MQASTFADASQMMILRRLMPRYRMLMLMPTTSGGSLIRVLDYTGPISGLPLVPPAARVQPEAWLVAPATNSTLVDGSVGRAKTGGHHCHHSHSLSSWFLLVCASGENHKVQSVPFHTSLHKSFHTPLTWKDRRGCHNVRSDQAGAAGPGFGSLHTSSPAAANKSVKRL